MGEYHISGAVFVLVKDGEILFTKGYGYADLDNQTPVVPDWGILERLTNPKTPRLTVLSG